MLCVVQDCAPCKPSIARPRGGGVGSKGRSGCSSAGPNSAMHTVCEAEGACKATCGREVAPTHRL